MRPIMWVAVICTVGLGLLAPLVVHVLAPADFGYRALARLIQIIALCAPAQVVYLGAASVIFNQKRTTPLAFSTPIAAALFVGMAVPLVSHFGVLGMAIAKVAGFALLAVATMVAAGRVADVPWRPSGWAPVIGVAVVGVLVLLVVPASAAAVWAQAGAAVLLGLAFAARIARMGILPRRATPAQT
jgi:O-antigen/teichoic acid export membrane protein